MTCSNIVCSPSTVTSCGMVIETSSRMPATRYCSATKPIAFADRRRHRERRERVGGHAAVAAHLIGDAPGALKLIR